MQHDEFPSDAAERRRSDAAHETKPPDPITQPDRDAVEAALARLVDAILPDPRRASRGRTECASARRAPLRRKGA